MLWNFKYEPGKYEIRISGKDERQHIRQVHTFVETLGERLNEKNTGPGGKCCLRRVTIEDDAVEMVICSEKTLNYKPDNKLVRKDHSTRLFRHYKEDDTVMLKTIDGFGSTVREHKRGTIGDLVGNGDWPEDILFRLLGENGVVPETLSVVTVFWADLRDLGVEEGDE